MNILFLVEGKKSEKKIYQRWLPLMLNQPTYVGSIQEIDNDNFTIISGNGYPGYFKIIYNAFNDIDTFNYIIDQIFICVDSEEKDYNEKYNEIRNYVENECPHIYSNVNIIIQHHCIETWLMGNKDIDISHTTNLELINYRNHYNVNQLDPELLYTPHGELIARYSLKYLKLMLSEFDIVYTKNKVNGVTTRDYFDKLVERFNIDGHIPSFGTLYNILNTI